MTTKTPTIHLNGTSRAELMEQFQNAHNALYQAMRALEDCAPNGRDYYPQGDSALSVAVAEHVARILAVKSVDADICALIEAIAE